MCLGFICLLASCGIRKTTTAISKMGCRDIVANVQKGTYFPDSFAAKYACEVTLPNQGTQKFGALLRSIRGEATTISISPLLGIELFRLYLFQDSVVFMNKVDKQYYIGSYDYLSEQLGTTVSLELVQDLVSARPLKYADSDRYRCERSKERYVVKNVPSRKLRKALGILKDDDLQAPLDTNLINLNSKPLAKALKKDDDLFLKRYYSDADFNLRRVIIQEVEENRYFEVNYGDQQNFSGITIPRIIELTVNNAGEELKMSINPSKFKTISSLDADYSIPDKYERIEFK